MITTRNGPIDSTNSGNEVYTGKQQGYLDSSRSHRKNLMMLV